MKIINHNAAAALFEKVEDLNQEPTVGWKCIYFKIPNAQERKTHAMPQFDTDIVTHMLARMKGTVYMCNNGEIFILYHGNYPSLTTRLSMYLWSLYSDSTSGGHAHQLFSVFDLSSPWESFYHFCEKRYMDAIADAEALVMFPRIETPIPADLLLNEHVAG